MITLYNYDSGTNQVTRTAFSESGTEHSRISEATFAGSGPLADNLNLAIREFDRLVIGEVFIPRGGQTIYASTII